MLKGSKMSPESVEKMRLTKIGRKMPPRTPEHRRNIALAKMGDKNPMYGTRVSSEIRGRIGLTMRSRAYRGELHHLWRGGYYDSMEQEIRHSTSYKEWRRHVFNRDDFTCQSCGKRGGKLIADHELPFAKFPALRLEILNGRTLCHDCNLKTPTYGGRVHARGNSSSY